MTARKKKRAAKKAHAPVAPALISVSKVLDECVAGISMIELSVRSLEENDGAATERVTLKRALKALLGRSRLPERRARC